MSKKKSNSANNQKSTITQIVEQWDLQLLVIPAMIFVLIFNYVPMYGVLMAFQEFKIGDFPGFSQWVGFKQFAYLFKDPNFYLVLRNTLAISILKLLIAFPLPIFFAVLINEIRSVRFKKSIQTISYLPHFISWVVASALMFDFLSTDGGAVNEFLMAIHVIKEPIGFFKNAKYFWGLAVVTDIWKELGWNSIIFIAAITGIDTGLYEAADIDGANRLQKAWYITVLSIKPTIILLFVFTVGGILNANFDQIMNLTRQMTNPMLKSTANVIDTYVYVIGISQGRYSFAAAAGLFKSIVNFALLLGANYLSGKVGEESVF